MRESSQATVEDTAVDKKVRALAHGAKHTGSAAEARRPVRARRASAARVMPANKPPMRCVARKRKQKDKAAVSFPDFFRHRRHRRIEVSAGAQLGLQRRGIGLQPMMPIATARDDLEHAVSVAHGHQQVANVFTMVAVPATTSSASHDDTRGFTAEGKTLLRSRCCTAA